MDKIRVIHDPTGHTLTIWWGDPETEAICEETTEEVVLSKDASGRVIGCEILHYRPVDGSASVAVEALVRSAA